MKNRLEELRKAPGIKQEELAEALEVSPSDDWLPGERAVQSSILLAFKLARFFGMTIEEIFIYEEDAT